MGADEPHHGQRPLPRPLPLPPVERREDAAQRRRLSPLHRRLEGGQATGSRAVVGPLQDGHDGAALSSRRERREKVPRRTTLRLSEEDGSGI